MAEILKGAPVAAAITAELTGRREKLNSMGIEPCLAILRVGAGADDIAYERAAIRRCEKIGIRTVTAVLPEDAGQAELIAQIRRINGDESVHGCLMLRPLPGHLDEEAACEAILPEKDVDSMTAASLKTIFTGRGTGYAPCTAQSCIEMLDYYGIDPDGKRAAVIGRSLVVGKPVSVMLQARNATVTMCHSHTKDLAAICRESEIVITAAGRAGMVDESYINPDQVLLDVGFNALPDGGICGDVAFDAVAPLVKAVSPVPAGVGSVTTAVLCKHVIEAAEKAASLRGGGNGSAEDRA